MTKEYKKSCKTGYTIGFAGLALIFRKITGHFQEAGSVYQTYIVNPKLIPRRAYKRSAQTGCKL